MPNDNHDAGPDQALFDAGALIRFLENPEIDKEEKAKMLADIALRGASVELAKALRYCEESDNLDYGALFESLIDGSQDPIFIYRADGTYLYVNKGFTDLCGLTAEEIIDKTPYEVLPADEAKKRLQLIDEIVKTGERRDFAGEIVITAGERRYQLTSLVPAKDDSGKVVRINCITHDITNQRIAEERLRHSQSLELIGELTSGIAHDYNNYLTAVIGTIELVRQIAIKADAYEAVVLLESALAGAAKMMDLSHSLKLLGQRKIEGSRKLDMVPVNIGKASEDIVNILKHTIQRNIEIQLNDAGNLYIGGDPSLISQVILNLCINARDAMPGGGLLTITTSSAYLSGIQISERQGFNRGEYVCLEVKDTGCGMSKETKGHIFERCFTTKKGNLDSSESGTGLGLAVVFGIVKDHGGFIQVESEVGVGSIFRVYLPKLAVAMPANVEPINQGEILKNKEFDPSDYTVMVVDDEKSITDLIAKILEPIGYKVVTVQSGQDAINLYKATPEAFSVLVLDLGLADMPGEKVRTAVKEIDNSALIIASSGQAVNVLGEDGEQRYAATLQKPYDNKQLRQLLQTVLQAAN